MGRQHLAVYKRGRGQPLVVDHRPGPDGHGHLVGPTPIWPATRESIVVSSAGGQATVPVTVRTTVPVGAKGGTFKGLLTGGNGRAGSVAQTNTYFFNVPPGEADLSATVALHRPRRGPDRLPGVSGRPDGRLFEQLHLRALG